MAQRGMLPKIRKTNAGSAPPLARPSIRPVVARKPPPPPAPPRKFPSGITPRGERTYDEDGDPATMMGFADPPTMSAPHAVPQAAPHRAPLVSFDEETQMRPVDDGLLAQSREDETWARIDARVDAHGAPSEAPSTVPHFPEPAHAHAHAHGHDIYESLPSLEVRRPFDTYEAEFAERDPATQLHAARHLHEQAPATHREDSGARERPRKYAAPVPVYDDSVDSYRQEPEPRVELSDPAIPRAAPVPSVPDGFIVGVQPIRTPPGGALFPAHDAFAHHAPQHHAPQHHAAQHQGGRSAPVPPATAAASPHAMYAQPYAQPYPQQQQQHYPAHTANAYTSGPRPALVATQPPPAPPMQPVGHQIQTMPPTLGSSRTLRFAWFVFGVAFGIGFTFFASGVVPGVKKDEPAATFPPAPAVPTQVAQPVQAPPPPVAPPVTAAAPPPAPAPLATPPVLATAEPAPAPAPPPVVQAKAPPPPPPAAKVAAAPRTPPRRPAPPPQSAAPKALPNSGSVDSDSVASDTSSSSSSAASKPAATASAEIPKDLFGAALNP